MPTPTWEKRVDAYTGFAEEIEPSGELRGREIPPTPEDVKALADDIRAEGQLSPILVTRTKTGLRVVAGETRRQAFVLMNQQDGLTGDARHRIKYSLVAGDELSLFRKTISENRKHHATSAVDDARNMQTLIDRFGMTRTAVAEYYGVSPATVSQRLRLINELTPEQRLKMHTGQIKGVDAALLLASIKPEQREEVFADAVTIAAEREMRKAVPVESKVVEDVRTATATAEISIPLPPDDPIRKQAEANLEAFRQKAKVTEPDIRAAAEMRGAIKTLTRKAPDIRDMIQSIVDDTICNSSVRLAMKTLHEWTLGKAEPEKVRKGFGKLK